MIRLPIASALALLLLASSSQALPPPPRPPPPPPPPAGNKMAEDLLAKAPRPPFSPQDMVKVEQCLQHLGNPKAKDAKEMTTRLIQDSGGFVKETTLEMIAAMQREVTSLFDEAVKSDPTNVEKLIDSGLRRLESQYDKVPAARCLKPVLIPTLRASRPMLIQSSRLARQKMEELWQSTIEPKLLELMQAAIVQAVGVVSGPDAKDVLERTLTKHLLDLPRIERATDRVKAYAKAVAARQNETQAWSAALPELAPKSIDKARFAFDFAIELARVKAYQFIDRGCPSLGGNDDGRSAPDWKEPVMMVNYYAVNRAENLLPGLACIVDVLLKQIEAAIDTVHTAADGSCAAVPFGGAAACTSVMWVAQFVAKYAALVVMKAAALQLAKTTVDVALLFAAQELKQRIEADGGFNRANAQVDKAFKRARPLGKALVPLIDKTMKGFLSEEGAKYFKIIEAYNASVRALVEATHKKALAAAR